MEKCLVIPSYPPHFAYVQKLCTSLNKYNLDKEITNIYLIITHMPYEKYQCLLDEYESIKINILFLEDIIFEIFINFHKSKENIHTANNLLGVKCNDRFSFQSIKKILGVKYVTTILHYDLVYVLDSEGLFIRPFSLNSIFKDCCNKKRIFFNSKQISDSFEFRNNLCNEILKTKVPVPGWFLENYLWIYEKNIIDDLFKTIFQDVSTVKDMANIIKQGTFIELVYYHYIYINNHKYKYEFIDTYETLRNYLPENSMIKILNRKKYSLCEDIRHLFEIPNVLENISKFYTDFHIINYKIYVNKLNLNFIKNRKSIILINSGDFNIDFEPCFD